MIKKINKKQKTCEKAIKLFIFVAFYKCLLVLIEI